MTEQRYHAVGDWFRARPRALAALKFANTLLPMLVYITYAVMVLLLLVRRDGRVWKFLGIPAAVFLGGTFLRAKINAPRPYEVYRTPPLVDKHKSGESFPSRHLFSASVITVCAAWICPAVGWFLGAVTVALAFERVLAGVHFVRDVISGAVLGSTLGILGILLFVSFS